MGTPEIAVYSLSLLLNSHHSVVGVVTVPDKPAGRGQIIKKSAIKLFAEQNNLPIFQPEKFKDEIFLENLTNLRPDIMTVVAFKMLPKEVWSIPKFGTINLHASLLPQYRGAAPINWAIINGEKTTGVTTFFIDEKIDTGKIIMQKKINIDFLDNAENLHDKIMTIGAEVLSETVNLIEKGVNKSIDQNSFIENYTKLKLAPKIFNNDCKINWQQNTLNTYNFIRGLSPYPGAWSIIERNNKNFRLKIFTATIEQTNHNLKPGTIKADKKTLKVAVNDGFIEIKKLKLQGKKDMNTDEFLRGFKTENAIFI